MAKQLFSVGQVLTAAQMNSLQQTAMLGGSATAKTASYTLVAADAGTVVSVNSTSATTITVNTGLFLPGDTVTIQNWGSGEITITAGTATVNTAGSLIVPQYDGGVLYFTSASAAIYFDFVQAGAVSPLTTKGDLYTFASSDTRLGVGANGTVLTADSDETTGLKWATPAGGATFVGASAFHSSAQSLSNDTFTAVNFTSQSFDTDNFHDDSVNNTRFTIPSGKAGKYLITFGVRYASNGTGRRIIGVRKNGTTYQPNTIEFPGSSVSGCEPGGTVSAIVDLAETDYLEVMAYQNSSGSLNINGGADQSTFAIQYLGA
jgi:hypothetical protein